MSDLFSSTADYYAEYRDLPPNEFLQILQKYIALTPQTSLLDLGAGTAQIPIFMHKLIGPITAIDPNKEMLEVAKRKTGAVPDISFINSMAENFDPSIGEFDIVSFGSSFHWMDKGKVLKKLHTHLKKTGIGMIIGFKSFWNTDSQMSSVIISVVKSFLGEERRAGKDIYTEDDKTFNEILRSNGYQILKEGEIIKQKIWNYNTILGMLYSTSFANKSLFGDNLDSFEVKLKKELEEIDKTCEFEVKQVYQYLIFKHS